MSSLIELTFINPGAAHLRLNCPERMNVLSLEMAQAFYDTVDSVLARQAGGALLLSGAGRNFMAGGDLNGFAAAADKPAFVAQTIDLMHGALERLAASDLITIAAVHGRIAGAGVSITAMADLVIAAEETSFTMAYSRIAGAPDCRASWALPRAVGLKRAMEMVLLNAPMSAEDAFAAGLINRIVPPDSLIEVAQALALSLSQGPGPALGAAKRLFRENAGADLSTALAAERAAFIRLAGLPDFTEGVSAFLERRSPDFTPQDKA